MANEEVGVMVLKTTVAILSLGLALVSMVFRNFWI